jgi:hypothetical protein
MNDPASRLADALRSAAQRLHDHTLDPACAALVPVTLVAIEEAVTTLGRAAYAAADALVPGNRDDSIADRYARAAAIWPSPRGGIGPSHDQQARVLTSLHDAAAALRAAAGRCGRAAENVTATIEYERRSKAA